MSVMEYVAVMTLAVAACPLARDGWRQLGKWRRMREINKEMNLLFAVAKIKARQKRRQTNKTGMLLAPTGAVGYGCSSGRWNYYSLWWSLTNPRWKWLHTPLPKGVWEKHPHGRVKVDLAFIPTAHQPITSAAVEDIFRTAEGKRLKTLIQKHRDAAE